MGRDLGNLVKLNLIVFALLLPSELLLAVAAVQFWGGSALAWLFLPLAAGAAVVLGPTLTALFLLVTKMLRDQPGFLWHDFKGAFRKNFRQTAGVGVALFLILALWVLAGPALLASAQTSLVALVGMLLAAVLLGAISPYYFLQAAYIDLPNSALLKNSLLLAFGHAPRSLLGALLGAGLMLLQGLFLPLTLPSLLLLGYSLPALFTMMCIWPPVDKQFSIDDTLLQRLQNSDESP